mgnify:CR=1 FL=1
MDFWLSANDKHLKCVFYCRKDGERILKGDRICERVEKKWKMKNYKDRWKEREGSSYEKADRKYLVSGIKSNQGNWQSVYRVEEYCMERNEYILVGYYKKKEQ